MAEADEKVSIPTLQAWSPPVLVEIDETGAGIHKITRELFAGAGNVPRVSTGWFHTVNLDIPPSPALEWLKIRADALRASEDSIKRVSDVSRKLKCEMYEAMRRGQVDAAWTSRSIEYELIKRGWWPRTRPWRSRR
jgi:hypothetical protein